jgi:hypothetical protein
MIQVTCPMSDLLMLVKKMLINFGTLEASNAQYQRFQMVMAGYATALTGKCHSSNTRDPPMAHIHHRMAVAHIE